MRLVIYGSQDVKTLVEWAKKFEAVPNYNYDKPSISEHPFPAETLGQFWKIVPIKESDEV